MEGCDQSQEDFDLDKSSLQLKTNSAVDSDQRIEQDEFVTVILWRFMGACSNKYCIRYCSPVPIATDKTWTITKSSTSLSIICNDVEVVNLMFDDADKNTYSYCV